MNSRNYGIAEGRLTKDPVVFANSDGSRKAMLVVAVKDNFKKADGSTSTQFVSLEAYIDKDKENNGVYDIIKKGDLVNVEYTVRSNNWKEENGKEHFGQVLLVQSVDIKESKRVTDARHAKNS